MSDEDKSLYSLIKSLKSIADKNEWTLRNIEASTAWKYIPSCCSLSYPEEITVGILNSIKLRIDRIAGLSETIEEIEIKIIVNHNAEIIIPEKFKQILQVNQTHENGSINISLLVFGCEFPESQFSIKIIPQNITNSQPTSLPNNVPNQNQTPSSLFCFPNFDFCLS